MINPRTQKVSTCRGNLQRTGFFDNELDPSQFELKWEYLIDRKIDSAPTVHNGLLFFGSNRRKMFVLDALSGELQWSFQTAGHIFTAPLIWRDLVVVGSDTGVYHAVSLATGQEKWRIDMGTPCSVSAAAVDNLLILGSDVFADRTKRGMLAGVDENGALVWQRESSIGYYAAPTIAADDETGYLGGRDGTMLAFDPQSGETKWQYKTEGEIKSTASWTSDGLYVCSDDNSVYGLNLDGTLKWRYQNSGAVFRASPATDGKVVYLGTSKGKLIALDAANGQLLNEINAAGPDLDDPHIFYSPSITNNLLFAGNSDRFLYIVDRKGFEVIDRIETRNDIPWTSITIHHDRLYFGGSGERLYAIGPT